MTLHSSHELYRMTLTGTLLVIGQLTGRLPYSVGGNKDAAHSEMVQSRTSFFIQSGAALLKLCFSSYGKETVINTCISPRALGVFSQRSGAALRALDRRRRAGVRGPRVLPITTITIHAEEDKRNKMNNRTETRSVQHEVVRGDKWRDFPDSSNIWGIRLTLAFLSIWLVPFKWIILLGREQ